MSNPSKAKGTRFETAVCDFLQWALDDTRIQRLTLHGSKDVGDIGNIRFFGAPVVIECKATKTPNYRKHWTECETEMGNMDTEYGWVIRKRPRLGIDERLKVGQHLAYTHKRVYFQMTSQLNEVGARYDTDYEDIPRNPELIGLTLEQLAVILNYGLENGPDNE